MTFHWSFPHYVCLFTDPVPKEALDFKVTTCFWEAQGDTAYIPSVANIIEILTGCNHYGESLSVKQQKPYLVEDQQYPDGRFSFEWFMKFAAYDQAKAIYDMNHDRPMASKNPFLKCFIDTAASMGIAKVRDPYLNSTCRIIKEMPESLVVLHMTQCLVPSPCDILSFGLSVLVDIDW